MYVKEMIKKEIDNLPDNLAAEVYDFIMFLENRKGEINLIQSAQSFCHDTLILSAGQKKNQNRS
ncbi:MAG: hypothetical protein A3I04_01160 [Nitrospinae bacterium RIFCSPLOWO2_02_FULL_39_110]|nr:MAG: hypothetical protein A2W53_01295 [Nitrospinae bacterium RIFCSPHIGHO2_02_39_11]OGV99193.1 MAG: hypothetical protein A3D97_01895 [Nitrospinae bacterium RIFCSPHIGHO2_12_FULL_39_42]OGW00853.1 MAG: hypothetical protein A3D20_01965 [Nitrospinae bacterium RIFCSPHIGHO2_02_FULL_39_82]OGW01489.1 MAG: hypothetical protein A2Z59_13155 [Nitrospinae bacterium RIFCSPLOWO2_02_39_17]OGW05093.1 MAG: hypothetical protein A3I04_01160 [Nitrospinae bacterium RIFCSPLOWO2_02_FULL_39_110]OGW09445.1 MAG: hypoth